MKNKLIIGRYLPNDSYVHHLDPRAKLMFVFFFYYINIFLSFTINISLGVCTILFFMRLAKIQLWFLIKGLTPIFFF